MNKHSFFIFTLFTISLFTLNSPSWATDFPFDTDESSADQIEKGLSEKSSIQKDERASLDIDKMDMGGSLKNEISYLRFKDQIMDDYLQNPNILTIYIDAKVSKGIRAYFKGRFVYDGTAENPSATSSTSTSTPASSPYINQTQSASFLEEMKVQFPIENIFFFTLGIQKIKWGSGLFWNPTDFLNSQTKDLVEKEDLRSGIDLIKLHLPIYDANLYAIGVLDKTNQSRNLANALRLEIPMSLPFLSGELSLSQYNQKDNYSKFGGDLSLGIGSIDFHFEHAFANVELQSSSVAGLSYDLQYSDKGLLNFTAETFWNESGADKTADYPTLITENKFVPFQVAKRYHAASLYLPTPGFFRHSDFSLTYIQNGIDKSSYTRFGYYWNGLKNLTLSLFIGGRSGAPNSEMKLGGITNDYALRTEIKF